MRHIKVHGTFTEGGYNLSRMAVVDGGTIQDETRNTVYNVLRLINKSNISSDVLIWDVGKWDDNKVWG